MTHLFFNSFQCTGPRASTPETFADALFNDNSSWAVTDRGPIEALVPVTRVLESTIEFLEDDNEDKDTLQVKVLRVFPKVSNGANVLEKRQLSN